MILDVVAVILWFIGGIATCLTILWCNDKARDNRPLFAPGDKLWRKAANGLVYPTYVRGEMQGKFICTDEDDGSTRLASPKNLVKRTDE